MGLPVGAGHATLRGLLDHAHIPTVAATPGHRFLPAKHPPGFEIGGQGGKPPPMILFRQGQSFHHQGHVAEALFPGLSGDLRI